MAGCGGEEQRSPPWLRAHSAPCLAPSAKSGCLFWHGPCWPQRSGVLLPFVARTGMSASLAGVEKDSKISISPRCGSVWRMPWGGWLRGQHLGGGSNAERGRGNPKKGRGSGRGRRPQRGSQGGKGDSEGVRGWALREERGPVRGRGLKEGLEGEETRRGPTSVGDNRLTILPPTHTCQEGWGRGLTHLAASLPGFH